MQENSSFVQPTYFVFQCSACFGEFDFRNQYSVNLILLLVAVPKRQQKSKKSLAFFNTEIYKSYIANYNEDVSYTKTVAKSRYLAFIF